MAFADTVHDVTFTPYAPGAGPQFHLRTWYGGVAIAPDGQSSAKLGYCLKMDGEIVIISPPGQEDYVPSSIRPFENEESVAFLMGYLTNDFLVGDLAAKSSTKQKRLLREYQKHLSTLWDYLVERYGEQACYSL